MKVLVCGSRRFSDPLAARNTIVARMSKLPKGTTVIHGGARGADMLAGMTADRLGLEVQAIQARWEFEGRKAGPLRNRRMLDEQPDLVLAFRNQGVSAGTDDCVAEARRRGIPVEVIDL